MSGNYLFSQEELKFRKIRGIPLYRGVGNTTARAFSTIAEAIRSPKIPIKITDHYNSRMADNHLAWVIYHIIDNTHLRGLEVDFRRFTLTFRLYEPKKRSSSKRKRR